MPNQSQLCDLVFAILLAASPVQLRAGDPDCGDDEVAKSCIISRKCDAGQYLTGESCIASKGCCSCPAGRWHSEDGHTDEMCFDCDAGQYQPSTGQPGCIECDSGWVQPTAGQSECIVCQAGNYDDDTETCHRCATGQYQEEIAQTSCIDCAAGKTAVSSETVTCADCPSGQVQPAEAATACYNCDAGTYDDGATEVCEPCEEGRSQTSFGQDHCVDCIEGYYRGTPGGSVCNPCQAGRFTTDQRNTECDHCPDGEVQPLTGRTVCTACVAGTYDDGTEVCANCLAGQIQPGAGQTECIECKAGQAAPEAGTICTDCEAGTFSAAGAGECAACEEGFTTRAGQAVSCLQVCPLQTVTFSDHATGDTALYGMEGDSVTVTCIDTYTGGGPWLCTTGGFVQGPATCVEAVAPVPEKKTATCTASSGADATACDSALDGDMATDWATVGASSVGSWIEFAFEEATPVSTVKYANRDAGHNEQVRLGFSDGSDAVLVLADDAVLNSFDFPEVVTTSVRITVLSFYGAADGNGAHEIELWGPTVSGDGALCAAITGTDLDAGPRPIDPLEPVVSTSGACEAVETTAADDGDAKACAYVPLGHICDPPPDPIDCNGLWNADEGCPVPCGGGVQQWSHSVTQVPLYGGADCPETPVIRDCNTGKCCGDVGCRQCEATDPPLPCPLRAYPGVCTMEKVAGVMGLPLCPDGNERRERVETPPPPPPSYGLAMPFG